MVAVLIIGGLSCITMILGVLFFPVIKIKKFHIDSYWVIVLIGALLIISTGGIDFHYLCSELVKDSSINPLKILTLFISMTILSVFLDEVGFFRYLASRTLKLAKNSQTKLFVWLYLIVSLLTVFTSNDIIVLTFTPFICYFAKNAKINPLPYLITEFVAANTMSMTLIIGNPTNIYIATSYGVEFLEYLRVMILPTLSSSIISFLMLYLLFRQMLREPANGDCQLEKITDKTFFIVGLINLSVCTVLLAIGSYIGLEMWIVSLIAVICLFTVILLLCLIKKRKPREVWNCFKRAPWQLIPFVLSMFTIILALQSFGITDAISKFLGTDNTVFKYGVLSFLSANVINNIPMSVFFCPIIAPLSGIEQMRAIYATIVGSNLGACFTPIGALAGIMWMSMLKKYEIKFSYIDFIKYGLAISLPSLAVNLFVLALII